MTLGNIDSRITYYTGADTNNFTAAQRLLAINQAQDEIETIIFRSQDDWEFDDANKTDLPNFTCSTVAGQASYGLPDIVQVKRVEVSYDGIKWDKATEINKEEQTNALDTTGSNTYFIKVEPKYYVEGNQLVVLPLPDSNSGKIKICSARLATEFTSSDLSTGTKVPGFDRQFHDTIAIRASFEYTFIRSLNNAPALEKLWIQKRAEIIDWYSHRVKDKKYQLRPRITNYK